MRAKIAFVTMFMFICLGAIAVAQDFSNEKPFTASELNKYIEDMPELMQWSESHGDAFEDIDNEADAIAASKEADAKLRSMGWSPNRFYYVTNQVIMGLFQLEMAGGSMQSAELDQAMQEIMSDPNLSAEEKQQVKQAFEEAMQDQSAMFEGGDVHPSEMALIKANQDRLMKGMELN